MVSGQTASQQATKSSSCGSKSTRPLTWSTESILHSQAIDVWQYCGFFGRVKLRKKITFLKNHGCTSDEMINQEKRLLFKLPFLRADFELQYRGGFLQVPSSICFYPVMSDGDWNELYNGCGAWDMDTWRKIFGLQIISPFARDIDGHTILHAASSASNDELCQLLIQLGVDPDHTNTSGAKALWQSWDLETMRVIATAQDDFNLEDLPVLFEERPRYFHGAVRLLWSMCKSSYVVGGLDEWATFFLNISLRAYGLDEERSTEWTPLVQELLRYGADVHARSLPSQATRKYAEFGFRRVREFWIRANPTMTFTPLDELFLVSRRLKIHKTGCYAQRWLTTLMGAGYDIDAYLRKESELHSPQNYQTYPMYTYEVSGDRIIDEYVPRRLIFNFEEHPSVHWDWWIDPSSPAGLVRHEFRHMHLHHSPYWYDVYHGSWRETWPFEYPFWVTEVNSDSPIDEFLNSYIEIQQESARKAASRHARRQARKKYPKDFEEIDRNSAIPGAWIEDMS